MKKTVKLGTAPRHDGTDRVMAIYATIEIKNKDGKGDCLSISGVEGPFTNGNAAGSCGQCYRETAEDRAEIAPAKGWTAEMIGQFFDTWQRWHLNDMRPRCEHQTGDAWRADKDLTFWHWRLKAGVSAKQKALKDRIMADITAGKSFTPTDAETELLSLEYSAYTITEAAPNEHYEAKKPLYSGDKGHTETKKSGWVYPASDGSVFTKEFHPEGILTKPCETCGYKYGSAWVYEPLPDDVVSFLESLPADDTMPSPWNKD